MSFKEIAEKPFVESCFGRYHWCKASDVQDRIKELEYAHDAELLELKVAYEAELKKLRTQHTHEISRSLEDRLKWDGELLQIAEYARATIDRIIGMADPRGEIKKHLKEVDEETKQNILGGLMTGSFNFAFTGEEVMGMVKSMMEGCKEKTNG